MPGLFLFWPHTILSEISDLMIKTRFENSRLHLGLIVTSINNVRSRIEFLDNPVSK